MTSRVQTGCLLVALAFSFAGCEGSRPTGPTGPTAPTTPTRPTATLSGLVFTATATGPNPVAGALVRLEIGSYRQDALTDQNGRYRLAELYDGRSTVTTTLDGYETDTRTVTVSGDVIVDIGIVARLAYTLSGMVYEVTASGQAPVAGVEMYCDSCGSPDGHTFVYTDDAGFYSLAWTFNGTHPLFVRKAGYQIAGATTREGLDRITATVRGDTRFDIQLVRR